MLEKRLGPDPSSWRWSRLHTARSPHDVFDRVGLLRPFFSLAVGQGGDASTVNVGSYRRDGSFLMTAGASYRQVLDFADLSRSRFVLTTGQSGNVFDRRYRDQLPLWHEGASFEIETAKPVKTLVFAPGAVAASVSAGEPEPLRGRGRGLTGHGVLVSVRRSGSSRPAGERCAGHGRRCLPRGSRGRSCCRGRSAGRRAP